MHQAIKNKKSMMAQCAFRGRFHSKSSKYGNQIRVKPAFEVFFFFCFFFLSFFSFSFYHFFAIFVAFRVFISPTGCAFSGFFKTGMYCEEAQQT